MAVIIQGPQGCGKTTMAKALMLMYGCTSILDEWMPGQQLPVEALVLTSWMGPIPGAILFHDAVSHLAATLFERSDFFAQQHKVEHLDALRALARLGEAREPYSESNLKLLAGFEDEHVKKLLAWCQSVPEEEREPFTEEEVLRAAFRKYPEPPTFPFWDTYRPYTDALQFLGFKMKPANRNGRRTTFYHWPERLPCPPFVPTAQGALQQQSEPAE